MDKNQKTAAMTVFLNIASITAIVIGLRVLIEFLGVQVFAICLISCVALFLVKLMYDNEVDRLRALDKLNNRSTDTVIK